MAMLVGMFLGLPSSMNHRHVDFNQLSRLVAIVPELGRQVPAIIRFKQSHSISNPPDSVVMRC